MSNTPQPGDTVKVTFTGKVKSVQDHDERDEYMLENAVTFTDGTVIAPGNGNVFFEVLQAAYVPQPGDLAQWKSKETPGIATPVIFLLTAARPTGCWYMTGVTAMVSMPDVDPLSDRFTLMVSGGKPVLRPSELTSERQAVLDNYCPKQGDVGTYRAASGGLVTVVFRVDDRYIRDTPTWRQTNGLLAQNAHEDPTFTLVLRGGVLQEGVNV